MKPGTKLKSATCDTEVMIIRYKDGEIACGGVPMTEEENTRTELDPAYAAGTQMGKRYVDAEGSVELLCVRAGSGSLSHNGVLLTTKDAKSLPSSD